MSAPKVFVREATGLVKDISLFNAWTYNASSMMALSYGPATYALVFATIPGADPLLSFVICWLLSLALLMVYVFFTATMPRSGAEYVFISRTLHPVLGWLASSTVWWTEALFLGLMAAWMGGLYVSAPLMTMGTILNLPPLTAMGAAAATPVWVFVIGTVALIGVAVISLHLKTYFKVQSLILIISIIAAAVAIGLLATKSPEEFIASFNRYALPYAHTSDPYHEVIALAKQNGFATVPFSWQATMVGMTAAAAGMPFAYFSAYCSGEMKGAASLKRQMIAMVGTWSTATPLQILATVMLVRAAGSEFVGASFYLSIFSPQSWPFPVAPFLNMYVAMLTDNLLLNAILAIGWFVFGLVVIVQLWLMLTRTLFAWSFDRVVPSFFADVNDTLHAPVKATIFILVLGEFFLLLFSQITPALATFLTYGMTLAFIVPGAFLLMGIAGVLFPYVRKDIYRISPASKYKIGKVPLISILGAIACAQMLQLIYYFLTESELGVNNLPVLSVIGLEAVAALALYAFLHQMRKRQGIDLTLAFKAIPPE